MAQAEKDLDTVKMVIERFMRSEAYCKAWHDNGEKWYKRYRFYRESGKYPYKHNVKDRLTFTIVEVMAAKIMKALFAMQPFISVVPTEKADVPIARQLEKVIDTIINNPEREFFLEFLDFVKQNLIYGTSFLSVTPRFNLEDFTFDGVNFDCEDYFDIFPDPACKRLSRAKFIIKRSIRYWDELKILEKKGVYKNVDDIKADTVADFDHKVKDRLSEVGLQTGVDYSDPVTGEVEILDYFEEGNIITVGARKVLLRDTKKNIGKKASGDYFGEATEVRSALPYHLPLVDVKCVPVPREFFGIGVPEVLEDDQLYLDLLRSQRLDNLDLLINKLFKVRIGSDTDPDMIYSAPGGIIPVTNMDDLDEFQISDVTGSSYKEQEVVVGRANDAIGQYGYGRGEQPARRETATGIVKLQEAAQNRDDLYNKLYEFTGIRPLGKKVVQIIREYMTQDQYERIIGEPDAGFYQYTQEELFQALDVVPQGTSITANKETRAQQVGEATDVLIGVDPMRAQNNNPPFAINLKKVLEEKLGVLDIKSKDDILVDMPPPPPPQPAPPPQGGMPGPGMPPPQGGMPPMGGPPMPPQGMPMGGMPFGR